jgi:hypothetical protein
MNSQLRDNASNASFNLRDIDFLKNQLTSLREIKKSRLLKDESFIYMICSDDRKNVILPAFNFPIFYDIDFGGFSEGYDNYQCEVLSLSIGTGFIQTTNYSYFVADNLTENGYFCKNKLNRKTAILTVVPCSTLQDIQRVNESSIISFIVNNCRSPKRVTFSFLKQDFTPGIVGTDINRDGVETKWVLTLKMTPIVDY